MSTGLLEDTSRFATPLNLCFEYQYYHFLNFLKNKWAKFQCRNTQNNEVINSNSPERFRLLSRQANALAFNFVSLHHFIFVPRRDLFWFLQTFYLPSHCWVTTLTDTSTLFKF